MKLAIDLHDTYLSDRELFNSIVHELKNSGHEVGIISCSSGIEVDFIPDFRFENKELAGEELEPQIVWKTNVMKENNITVLFDDMASLYGNEVIVIDIIRQKKYETSSSYSRI